MSGNPRRGSPGPDAAAAGFVARWSARKHARGRGEGDVRDPAPAASAPAPADAPPAALTDADMPPLETLDAESDYSGFLSAGVSDALRRLALRKLFGSAKFQLRDGLDDYDADYNLLTPLRSALAEAARDAVSRPLRSAPDAPERVRDARATPPAAARETDHGMAGHGAHRPVAAPPDPPPGGDAEARAGGGRRSGADGRDD